jgi:hypothetical protein
MNRIISSPDGWHRGVGMMAAGLFVLAGGSANATPVYLNDQNITVELGTSHAAQVIASPTFGPFANVNITQSLANIIDAPSATAGELHNQQTHVWVNGGHLELDFDFGVEYDLTTLHFWNYHSEGFDVDDILFTFFDGASNQVGLLNVQPLLGNATGTDSDPIFAEDYALNFPSNVRYVNAMLTGNNGQVDFNNIGFTAVLSDPNPDPDPNAIPEPATLTLLSLGLAGFRLIRRRRPA